MRPVSKASVNRQDSDITVKSIVDQSPKSCEFLVQSRVQSTVQSTPESRYCKDPFPSGPHNEVCTDEWSVKYFDTHTQTHAHTCT